MSKSVQILIRLTPEDLKVLDAFVEKESKRTGYDLTRAHIARTLILRGIGRALWDRPRPVKEY